MVRKIVYQSELLQLQIAMRHHIASDKVKRQRAAGLVTALILSLIQPEDLITLTSRDTF